MSNPRLMAITLPFMCVLTALLFVLAIPFAIGAMVVMLIRPGSVKYVQERAEKIMIHKMFSRMTRKVTANV